MCIRDSYWDTSKLKLGENTFDGSILKMVGAENYSQFTTDLKNGYTALAIDAFDEAEAISGRTAVQQFIEDLERCVKDASAVSYTHLSTQQATKCTDYR